MGVQASGVGSGLDVNGIISSLMELERQPLETLTKKQSTLEAQISAYGGLKSKISDFQSSMESLSSLSSFKVFNVASSNDSALTASASSSAVGGDYTVNVTQLATKDKIATKGYADGNTLVGEGVLTLSIGGNSFEVTVDGSNNTVLGIKDAVNNASGNTGVTASIVNDDSGAHLIFSAGETGTANALKITVADSSDSSNTDDLGLSSLAYESGVTVHRAAISTAEDAIIEVDGFTATSSSNMITGVIEGVTIDVKSLGTSTVAIRRDDSKITESVQKFVDSFNALRDEISAQREDKLEADSTLLTIERQLLSVINSGSAITGSNQSYLIEVGVSIDKFGKMSSNADTLQNIIDTDFKSLTNLFAAKDEGFAYRFDALTDGWLKSDGLIDSRQDGLKKQIDTFDDRKEMIETRLVTIERRLRTQFSALDSLVSSLNSTGSFLAQQLAN